MLARATPSTPRLVLVVGGVLENKICVGQAETQAESNARHSSWQLWVQLWFHEGGWLPTEWLKDENGRLFVLPALRALSLSCPCTMKGCFQQEIRVTEDVRKCEVQGFPWWSSDWDSPLPMRGAWVLSLVGIPHTAGFPGGASGEEPACQWWRHKRLRFDPWVRKMPWNRKWHPTAAFLPGESPWTEEPGGELYSPWCCTESDTMIEATHRTKFPMCVNGEQEYCVPQLKIRQSQMNKKQIPQKAEQ